MITLTGKKISEGIAIGKLSFYKRDLKDDRQLYVKDIEKEVSRLNRAREKARMELMQLYESSVREMGEANASIFEMQQEMLDNHELMDSVISIIVDRKLNAEYAMKHATQAYLKEEKDKAHEADVRDVAIRIIRILSHSRNAKFLIDEPIVMAAGELYPSEVLQIDKTKVMGVVTRYGTINSHTAVIARTKGIPTVIGLGESLKQEYEGKTIIIDGYEGKVYIEPDYTLLKKMKDRQDQRQINTKNLERLKGKANVTQSGQKIDISANIGTREDIERVLRSDAGGIGLFRSEFLYMENGKKLPGEEQQYQTYKLASEAMGLKRVVIRTADLGGDKLIEAIDFSDDKNGALGMRGIRISLEKPEIFKTQLRAILRASAHGNIAIMFPMISSLDEVRKAKELVETVKKELQEEKIPFDKNIQVGAMIETPAAVLLSGELAREVDFLSIGTNDLTQFTLGMSRENEKLEPYYDTHHPALLKMIRIVTNNVHLEEKTISICGDLASDLSMTEFFIQIGIDELSVDPENVLSLRKKIREIR